MAASFSSVFSRNLRRNSLDSVSFSLFVQVLVVHSITRLPCQSLTEDYALARLEIMLPYLVQFCVNNFRKRDWSCYLDILLQWKYPHSVSHTSKEFHHHKFFYSHLSGVLLLIVSRSHVYLHDMLDVRLFVLLCPIDLCAAHNSVSQTEFLLRSSLFHSNT